MAEDTAATEEQEPSIEEILTSIRQIISDDDDAEAEDGAETEAPEEEATPEELTADEVFPEPEEDEQDPVSDEKDDIIELTDVVEEPEEEDTAEPEPEPEEEPEVKVDLQDAAKEEPMPKPTPKPEPVETLDDLESLLTNNAKDATYEGFAEVVKKTAIERGGITLEEIVRGELSPLLREWLDKHLPVIIERLVQEELEKIAKRALEDLA